MADKKKCPSCAGPISDKSELFSCSECGVLICDGCAVDGMCDECASNKEDEEQADK